MSKVKYPGLLSNEERIYLETIKSGGNPKRKIKNPSRVKLRILELQQNLPHAIECCVRDVCLLRYSSILSKNNKIQLKPELRELESELASFIHAKRLAFLKYFYYKDPLYYLLIGCLDAFVQEGLDPWQEIKSLRKISSKARNLMVERIKNYPGVEANITLQKEIVELFNRMFTGIRKDLLKYKKDVEWFMDHQKEVEVLLTLYSTEYNEGKDSVRWVYRDKIADILQMLNKRVTRLFSTLVGKGFVERTNHKYRVSKKGELAIISFIVTFKDRDSNLNQR